MLLGAIFPKVDPFKIWRKAALAPLWLLCCPVVNACPANIDPAMIRSSFKVDVEAGIPKLLAISQTREDLAITVVDPLGNIRSYDSPAGRHAIEFVYLPAEFNAEYQICTHAVFANSAHGTHEIQISTLTGSSGNQAAAFEYFNAASALWHQAISDSYSGSADNYDSAGATNEGIPYFTFFSRLNSALAYFKSNQYTQAKQILELLRQEVSPPGPYGYQVFQAQGSIALRERKYGKALEDFTESLGLLDKAELSFGLDLSVEKAEILNLIALTHLSTGELESGKQYLNAAIAGSEGDHRLISLIYNNLAYLSIKLAETPDLDANAVTQHLMEATDQHLIARYFSYGANDVESMIVTENNTAAHYRRIGDRRKTQEHYGYALQLLDSHEIPQMRNLIYGNLWQLNIALGDYQKALSYLNSSIQLTKNSGSAVFALNLCRMGETNRLLNDLPGAIVNHENCAAEALGNNDMDLRANALLNLGRDYREFKNLPASYNYSSQAFTLLPQIKDQQLRAEVLANHALVLAENGNFDTSQIRQALELGDKLHYPESHTSILQIAMNVAALGEDANSAIAYGYEAIELVENMYTSMEAERIGPSWSNKTHEIYNTLFEFLVRKYGITGNADLLKEAFSIQERSRAISLRQLLANNFTESSTNPDQKRLQLLSQIGSLLAGEKDIEEGRLRNIYYHHQDVLALTRAAGLDALPVPPATTLDSVQQKLTSQEAVLHYTLTKNDLYLFFITKESFSLRLLSASDVLKTQITPELLRPKANGISIENLRRISNLLLPADLPLQRYPRLMVVADTGLNQVPFSALHADSDQRMYVPLIQTHEMKLLPSLSAYFMDKPINRKEYSMQAAVFADPFFGENKLIAESTDPEKEKIRSWSDSLAQLPYTAWEAQNLIDILGPGSVKSFTGKDANRTNLFSQEAREARILHIATHGYFKSTSEDNVGLALSTNIEEGVIEPGFVTLSELFAYNFFNELVVISGCDTAIGLEQQGSGMNSVTRGFLAKGANHIISTLWPVSDRGSAKFMTTFYKALKQEQDVTRALQTAQRDFIADPQYRNPYYWAGYVLTTTKPNSSFPFNSL